MRETAATTGTPAEAGEKSAEDLEVSGKASGATNSEQGQPDAGSETGDSTERTSDQPLATSSVSATPGSEQAASDAAEPGDPGRPVAGSTSPRQLHPALGVAERPTFTRPPGMFPPPEVPGGGGPEPDGAGSGTSTTAPVSGAPDGTDASGVRMRPIDPAAAIGSARVNEAIRSTRAAAGPRGPRRARLTLKRLDPWSVMKFSFAVSLVMFIVVIVAASVLYLALDAMGVFESVNTTLADLMQSGGAGGDETIRITASWVIGTAASVGAINVVLFTALATLGAFIYNVCADLVGGVEVTLAERD